MTQTKEKQYTQEELRKILADEAELVKLQPLDLIDCEYMYIKTKTGDLIPLKTNSTQQKVDTYVRKCRNEKKPIRIWILKFRQGGISTLIEAYIYSLTSQQENRNALVMADEDGHSNYLFGMHQLYQEKLEEKEPHLSPKLKKSNEKKLEFEGIRSQIIPKTGANVKAARASTWQYVHLSECAFFPHLLEVMEGLMQAVPDHWDTMVIGETTANGMDNEFYDEWQKAKLGKSEWFAMFLGWYMMEEYSRPLYSGGAMEALDGIQFDTEGGEKDFLKEEELLQRTYNLTNEQLNWRRWCIKNKCSGQVRTFRQEYPADDEEAFLTSGNCVFDTVKLKNQKLNASVKAVGTLYEDASGKVVFRKEMGGYFRLFQDIGLDMRCVIGADVSEGVGKDECAAFAVERRTNNTVMSYIGNSNPDVFAQDLDLMGRYCNMALIAPENNSMGFSVCSDLMKTYPNVYTEISKNASRDKNGRRLQKVGWTTNVKTRGQMIAQLIKEIREDATELRDPVLIDQCLGFVRKPNGKIEAQNGKKDDCVIARMIAGMARQKHDWDDNYESEPTHKKVNFMTA